MDSTNADGINTYTFPPMQYWCISKPLPTYPRASVRLVLQCACGIMIGSPLNVERRAAHRTVSRYSESSRFGAAYGTAEKRVKSTRKQVTVNLPEKKYRLSQQEDKLNLNKNLSAKCNQCNLSNGRDNQAIYKTEKKKKEKSTRIMMKMFVDIRF